MSDLLLNAQAEREALINLMLVARFSDKKLTIAEEETFVTILAGMKWDDVINADSFVNENIPEVRDAVISDESLEHYLNQQCGVFTSAESKQIVLTKIAHILQSDGMVEDEIALYKRIEAKLK